MLNFSSWPNLRLYARDEGEIDPYDPQNSALFRGEEAFAPEVEGWQRWSKPSPEPRLDEGFEAVLLASIGFQAPLINALARELSRKIAGEFAKPPVLVAVLRAGAPICALLAPLLEKHYAREIPVAAFSLFYGLGWDEAALRQILADFPDRPLLFVDGWTSGGGVSKQLRASFEDWRARGAADFTRGNGPKLAVLCDPRRKADLSAVCADIFVPSSPFTAPETLGFSRGFARADGGLFGVYRFPEKYRKATWIEAWMQILEAEIAPLPPANAPDLGSAPAGFRVDSNEVTRALINRDPREIWIRDDLTSARKNFAPLLYLAQLRAIPVVFEKREIQNWGASVVAKMK